jgi:hypothetical protein
MPPQRLQWATLVGPGSPLTQLADSADAGSIAKDLTFSDLRYSTTTYS